MLRAVLGRVSQLLFVLPLLAALTACNAQPGKHAAGPSKPAPGASPGQPPAVATTLPAHDGPRFIHGEIPVAPFVAEQLLAAPPGSRTLVYAGASWCEPCQRFHRAVEAGELDAALPGVRFIEYDYDLAKQALSDAGYATRLIPLFARPDRDGFATAPIVAGSIKGEGAVQNIVPRLQALLASR